jgi:signal transduction histidine kinase
LSTKRLNLHPFSKLSIRTKLRLNAVITIGLATVVALTVFVSSRNMEEAGRNDRFASRVIKDVSDLTSLTYAYLLLKDTRPKVQWEVKHASLGKELSEQVAGSREQEALLARLRSNHEQIKRLFEAVSHRGAKKSAATESASSAYDELNEGITAQLLARAEMMTNDASLLNRESERRLDATKRAAFILIVASASFLIVSAAITASLLAKNIGGSIRALERGTERIASGDLGHQVVVTGNDEISRLAAAFNQMAAQLRVDTTAREKAEQETRNYASRLELSNRELQDFAFVASHDLQEPLRKIQAFGDQLTSGYGDLLDEEGRDYLSRMQNAASRMQALIQSLLNYSRVTTKAQPFSVTDLTALAREAVADLELRVSETRAQVEIGDLPTIEADPTQMQQLFQNLIGNALKFHGDEKPIVRIYSRDADTHPANGNYQILIEDNGIGFDEKYLDRIFTPFQRLHTRGAYEGTGIGLAICRKIAERHGGTITAKSSPGKGSTFIVTLPAKQADRSAGT